MLPLPVAKVRAISLEHHLALAALRCGHGSVEQMSVLLKVVYQVHFMADAALRCCGLRGDHEGCWTLPAADHAALAQVLVLRDGQLGSLPAFRYTDAWAQIHAFLASDALSPLPEHADV
ncbi:hypothetical protein [Burkholderia sp. Bp8986]|uniref:hypothetical protein n=1 Tax=Burkholderia sp. Bp8986 TaxID=2184550 RepID=UPI0021AB842D|nr:hypothetical protein [Burkholderia sp. Bp8986]